jgi:hypothetical protein
MTPVQMLELLIAVLLLGAGIWLYRRNRSVDDGYGSQGAVILFIIAIIVAIHGLGLMHYRPSQAEIESAGGQ